MMMMMMILSSQVMKLLKSVQMLCWCQAEHQQQYLASLFWIPRPAQCREWGEDQWIYWLRVYLFIYMYLLVVLSVGLFVLKCLDSFEEIYYVKFNLIYLKGLIWKAVPKARCPVVCCVADQTDALTKLILQAQCWRWRARASVPRRRVTCSGCGAPTCSTWPLSQRWRFLTVWVTAVWTGRLGGSGQIQVMWQGPEEYFAEIIILPWEPCVTQTQTNN